MKNKIKYIIFLVIILVVIIIIFKPLKFEKILRGEIDSYNITSIEVKELINAYTSNDYTLDDKNQISEFYNKISDMKVSRCIFIPKVYSIEPNKSYRITLNCNEKVLIISINTDGQNQYITANDKTYKVILNK